MSTSTLIWLIVVETAFTQSASQLSRPLRAFVGYVELGSGRYRPSFQVQVWLIAIATIRKHYSYRLYHASSQVFTLLGEVVKRACKVNSNKSWDKTFDLFNDTQIAQLRNKFYLVLKIIEDEILHFEILCNCPACTQNASRISRTNGGVNKGSPKEQSKRSLRILCTAHEKVVRVEGWRW